MARLLFWASALLLAYTFVFFPLVVILRGLLRPQLLRGSLAEVPRVSIVVAAHNEAPTISAKIENLLEDEYPADRREIIIVSDGSSDSTADIVRSFEGRGVRLIERERAGKAAALLAGVDASRGEVLVFTDANSSFREGSLFELVRPYADPAVGGVAGNQVYRSGGQGSDAGERAYWGFDRLLKEYESRAGQAISATGSIYSIRRELFQPIPAGVNDDFYVSLGVIRQGRRLVFAPNAVSYEEPASSLIAEYRRKVRVLSRAMRCAIELRELFDVRRYGFYSIQLLSHKVLRWLTFVPVLVIGVTSARLARDGGIYLVAAAGQIVAYALAAAGLLLASGPSGANRLLSVPAYFVASNVAAAVAVWNTLTGRRIDRWQPARGRDRVNELPGTHE